MSKVDDKMGKQKNYKQIQSIIIDFFCKENELEIRIKIIDFNRLKCVIID